MTYRPLSCMFHILYYIIRVSTCDENMCLRQVQDNVKKNKNHSLTRNHDVGGGRDGSGKKGRRVGYNRSLQSIIVLLFSDIHNNILYTCRVAWPYNNAARLLLIQVYNVYTYYIIYIIRLCIFYNCITYIILYYIWGRMRGATVY